MIGVKFNCKPYINKQNVWFNFPLMNLAKFMSAGIIQSYSIDDSIEIIVLDKVSAFCNGY